MEDITAITISNYLEWVKSCHDVEYGPDNEFTCYQEHVYFRGQASTSWDLVPSLFRDEGRIHDEHKMLQMAGNMAWTELSDCRSDLEKLIKLQHYGLHTRLLDVTYNPLIALYFACQNVTKNEDDNNGIVYCGYKDVADTKIAEVIAKYIFNYDTININQKELNNLCKEKSVNECLLEDIHLLDPPLNNVRISKQNGAFIIAPLLSRKAIQPFQNAGNAYIRNELKTAFTGKCVIPQDNKTAILKELDYMGFNKASIFLDISSKLEYINETEDRDWPTLDLS